MSTRRQGAALHQRNGRRVKCAYVMFWKESEGAPGGLHMWLSPSQQMVFDETGICPTEDRVCCAFEPSCNSLFLPRRGRQPHANGDAAPVVPPFSILVDQPGGYRSECASRRPIPKW